MQRSHPFLLLRKNSLYRELGILSSYSGSSLRAKEKLFHIPSCSIIRAITCMSANISNNPAEDAATPRHLKIWGQLGAKTRAF
jgi:hypothetical protein